MKLVNIRTHLWIMLVLAMGIQSVQAQEIKTLDQCIETAMDNNKKLEIGENNIQNGKDRQTQVKANLRPKVSIEADYKYFLEQPTQLMPASAFNPMAPEWKYNDAQFGVPHNINANLIFGMPIYNPELKSKIENVKMGIEVAELQLQKSAEDIQFDISNLYYNAQIILSQMKFMDDNINTSNQLHKTISLVKSHGLAKGTDVDKISLQILQLKAKRDVLQSKYEQVLNGIKMLMGISLDEKFDIESNIAYKEIADYSNKATSDVKMVELKNKLLNGELNTIDKSKLPSVMLYGSLGATGYGYDKSPNEFLDFYGVGFLGVKASYTIFDGNMAKKKKKIKLREIENNRLQLNLLKDKNHLQITNSKLKIAVASKNVETNLAQIDFAKTIYDKTVIQQKNGVASITDVLLADSTVREAQQNYLSAIVDYLKADLELKKISGNLN